MVEENQQNNQEKTQVKETKKRPDYVSDGVAVWINTRPNGQKYLSIKMPGHETVYVNER